jgi:hypothetical protein
VNRNFRLPRLRRFLALGSLIATTCFAGTPLATLSQCAATVSPGLSGLKSLSAACPDLPAALTVLGLDKILYEGWQDNLNVHALNDAILLSERYSGAGWHRAPPGTSSVPAIIQALKDEQAPPVVSWWRSFKNWLKNWLEHSDSAIAKWIKHLLDGVMGTNHVSERALQIFVDAMTVLAALTALFVIGWELKAAGVTSLFRRGNNGKGPPEYSSQHPSSGDSDLDENTLGGLLRMLVKRLSQTGRLTAERSLTHRELIARAAFDEDAQKSVFAGVAYAAETMLYGAEPPVPETRDIIARQGRELLRQISNIEDAR